MASYKTYDLKQLSAMLASRVEDVCQWLLPQGRKEGNEWRAGNVFGDEGHSLGVNIAGKAGTWCDFAGDEKGGDLIDLIMAVKGVSLPDAIKEAKDFLGIVEERPRFSSQTPKEYKEPKHPNFTQAAQVYQYFASRGISVDTLKRYKVGQDNGKNGPRIVFSYFFDGKHVFTKYRSLANKHDMIASPGAMPCLYGWQGMPENCRSCVIVEGEIDALSFSEKGVHALSVPFGGGDGNKQDNWIDTEWEHLQAFDAIFLALDNDAEGQKAARHIVKRLGAHRCFLVDLGGYKDANEALMAGFDISPSSPIWQNARTLDPEELSPGTSYLGKVRDLFNDKSASLGHPLPWDKTRGIVGLRDGETTVWAGISGHGKSQLLGHVIVHSMSMGQKWCIASMEFKPEKLLLRMCRQMLGSNQPKSEQDYQAISDFMQDNLWMFDTQGTVKHERILEVFEYAYRRYGITNFLIDSLAKCGFAEDDYNGQKKFVDLLSDFARNNGVQVHLICHSRKSETEEKVPDKFDIKGTGAITDMVDNVFIVWRNKPKERAFENGDNSKADSPDCILACVKQREGDWEGRVGLFFDKASLQYLSVANAKPVRYCHA